MTCIVGLRSKGSVFIGGDSAGVGGWDLVQRRDEKVFVREQWALGFTTSFRMGQLLRYSLALPTPPRKDLEKFMATTFIDAVRKCLKEGGFANKDKEVETGGAFLVGVRGRLFSIGSDYQVGESRHPFDAVGCGADYALGCLASIYEENPRRAIRRALLVAERFSAGVRGPFRVVAVP